MYSKPFLKILCSAALLALSCAPTAYAASSSLSITEIMYDAPGANAGHQWIEVANTGNETADLSAKDLRFFDKGGAHVLAAYAGSANLAPGNIAVVADKPEVFLADHPGFSGLLFDSVVSLTASDTIGFKRTGGTVLDSISYTSALGAKGDGNTLHRSGSGLVSGGANPGVAGIPPPAKPAASTSGITKSEAKPSPEVHANSSQSAYDNGISAPAPEANTAGAGAALSSSRAATADQASALLASPWFAGFLALLVFSGASLILIRKHA